MGPLEMAENILNGYLSGGFKYFLCSPLFGEDEPILTIIFFQMGWFNHQLSYEHLTND